MSADQWSVAVREPNEQGFPAAGHQVIVREVSSEAAARQPFADQVRLAKALGYTSVMLQYNDVVMQGWPA